MAGRHPMPPWQWLEAAPIQYDLATLMRADPPRRGFEKPGEAEAELAKRVELLSTSALPGAARLATKLRCDDGAGPVPSLANPVYCRAWRRVTGSGLMVCIRQARRARLEVRAFTIVLPHHTVPADHLHLFDPATVTTSMRRLLLKHLPPNPTGWLYLRVHGEYEGTSDTFVIHAHGLASGDYLTTLNGPVRRDLRKLRKLANDTGRVPAFPTLPAFPTFPTFPTLPSTPKVRVVLRIDPLRRVARQVSYVLQSWWPSRPVVMTPKGWKRVRDKGRIPEPHHSRYLIWLDRQSISSLRLRMGLGSGG